MTLFEYVKKYGDYSFEELSFNDVDNIIFSQIPYLPLEGVVLGFGHRPVVLSRLPKQLEKTVKYKPKGYSGRLFKKIYKLLIIMSTTKRYKDIKLYNYMNIIDHEKQFGAVTLRLPDNSVYISYEGTNSAISGWYEDARMTYLYPIPAQELAANYLRKTLRIIDQNVRVGGHSKGGNLAIYATLEAPFYLRNKIIDVYNNDGPGFFKEIFTSRRYQRLLPKIRKIVPCESVVGMFLYQNEDITVVKSKRKRVLQHDPFNWQVDDTAFMLDELSSFSRNVSLKTNEWLARLEKQKKKDCFDELFSAFDNSNIEATYHLYSFGKTKNFIRHLYHIEEENKDNLIDVVKELIW